MRLLRRVTIKWRITIGTLLVAMVLSSVAVVIFRAQVEHILTTTTTTLLHNDAAPYITGLTASGSLSVDRPGRGQLVAVIDPAGTLVLSSMPKGLENRLAEIAKLPGAATTVVQEDDFYRVYHATVITNEGAWTVVTARNQDSSILSSTASPRLSS